MTESLHLRQQRGVGAKSGLYSLIAIIASIEALVSILWFIYVPARLHPTNQVAMAMLFCIWPVAIAIYGSAGRWKRIDVVIVNLLAVGASASYFSITGQAQRWDMMISIAVIAAWATYVRGSAAKHQEE